MYCMQCHRKVEPDETILEEKQEQYNVLGECVVTITSKLRLCGTCQCEVEDPELDDENLTNAYEEYERMTGKKVVPKH